MKTNRARLLLIYLTYGYYRECVAVCNNTISRDFFQKGGNDTLSLSASTNACSSNADSMLLE